MSLLGFLSRKREDLRTEVLASYFLRWKEEFHSSVSDIEALANRELVHSFLEVCQGSEGLCNVLTLVRIHREERLMELLRGKEVSK